MNQKPSHLSFDAWNTLITPNAQFAYARNEYLAKRFNTTVNFAAAVYTHFKSLADKTAAEFGHQYETGHLYQILTKTFHPAAGTVMSIDVQDAIEGLFRKHPPIFEPQLVVELRAAQEHGATMNVLSNTNFIGGYLLRDTVFKLWQERFGMEFNFGFYSNEEMKAKPSKRFFELMIARAQIERPISRDDIIHVGDSIECDVRGAQQSALKFYKVANPAETLQFMKEYNAA